MDKLVHDIVPALARLGRVTVGLGARWLDSQPKALYLIIPRDETLARGVAIHKPLGDLWQGVFLLSFGGSRKRRFSKD